MSSPALIQTVVLAGAGNLGTFIVDALFEAGVNVIALTRSSSNKSLPSAVQVKAVNYSDAAALEAAVKGADAVVSALTAPDAQNSLIRASKKAGVKLFLPAEFGNPSTKLTSDDHPALFGKKLAQDLLKEVGLPATLIFTGPFLDTTFGPFFGFELGNGKVTIIGKGETPISFTSRRDIARFVAHYLKTLTSLPSPSEPAILRLQGDRSTFNGVVETYERVSGKRIEITHTPLEEAEKEAKDLSNFFGSLLSYLRASWERGATVDEGLGDKVLSGKEWPEWKPLTIEQYFQELIAKK